MKKILLLLFILPATLSGCLVVVEEEPVVVYDYRNDFVGSYSVEEYSETFDTWAEYSIRIVRSAGYPQSVYIRNFYGLGLEIIADVEGRRLYIPEQEVNGYHIEGSGRLVGTELRMDYSVHDHYGSRNITDFCSTVAWR